MEKRADTAADVGWVEEREEEGGSSGQGSREGEGLRPCGGICCVHATGGCSFAQRQSSHLWLRLRWRKKAAAALAAAAALESETAAAAAERVVSVQRRPELVVLVVRCSNQAVHLLEAVLTFFGFSFQKLHVRKTTRK
jgi:hypothetical protein